MKFDYKKIVDEVCSKNFFPRLIVMIISTLVLAINYNLFLFHNDLVIGGSSGIATIIHYFTELDPAVFIMGFNCVFIVISFILLGARTTGMTLIGAVLYPLFVSLTSGFCSKIAGNFELNEFILVAIISGILYGAANGFIYKTGYSTGGVDIIIQIVNKYLKVPTGHASFVINFIIIAAGGITFGLNKAIYATIIIFINSILVDRILIGISNSKMFYIHTKKAEEVKKYIRSLNTGFTIMKTEGGYSNTTNDIIMCVIPTSNYYMFKNVILNIDPSAFFIICDCYEVYGGHRQQKFPFI